MVLPLSIADGVLVGIFRFVEELGEVEPARLPVFDQRFLLEQRGQSIDVVTGSVIFWRGVGTLPQWDALFSPLWLPGHAWEFSHRHEDQAKGNCAAFVQSWQFVPEPSRSQRAQILSWGEWIDVKGK